MHASETSQPEQKSPVKRAWRWLLWTVVAIITFAFCWVGWQKATWHAYSKESEGSWNALDTTLRHRRPPSISRDEWNSGVNWAVNAHTNIFIGPRGASYQSVKQFREQLDDKLKGEIDSSIFDWIWDQFEQAGPAGKQYARFRPAFEEDRQAYHKRHLDALKDLEAFQGRWNLISAERDGKKTPQEEVKKLKLTIQANKFILEKDSQVISEGTFSLDPSKKPKAIDETITAGPNKGKVFLAIYEIVDEDHKICFAAPGKDRPPAFSSLPGSGNLLQVWEREKK
jgi:uncharacterized protein (TIGR03067 family)